MTRRVLLIVGVTYLSVSLIASAVIVFVLSHRTDYSRLPKHEVFQTVWRVPVPQDVHRLHIAGYGMGGSASVWMRIDAPADTLKRLMGTNPLITRGEFWRQYAGGNGADARAVGWYDIQRLPSPQFYAFDRSSGGQGWYGLAAADFQQGRLYVFANVL
jgi:hypothetical protein